MSKRTSKLSRKCVNKDNVALKINALDNSSDDFQDNVRPLTRNNMKHFDKNNKNVTKEDTHRGQVLDIHSVCKNLSVKSIDKCQKTEQNHNKNAIKNEDPVMILSKYDSEKQNQTSKITIPHSQKANQNPKSFLLKDDTKIDTLKTLEILPESSLNAPEPITKELEIKNGVNLKLAPCPLCNKEFKFGSECKRISHLKECGTMLGVRAEDLVKLRRLEVLFITLYTQIVLKCTIISRNRISRA